MSGPIIVAIVFGVAFGIFVIFAIIQGQRRKLTAGVEEMVGKTAVAQTSLNPKGTVRAEGEIWAAIAEEEGIEPGEEVIITKVEGLKLRVAKKTEGKEVS
jgi:membrane-bound serine protease (ClpP class)